MADVVKILGTVANVAGAAENFINVVSSTGATQQVDVSENNVVAVKVDNPHAAAKLVDVVGAISPAGNKLKGLKALYPDLPTKLLNAVLNLSNNLTAAVKNDGVIDHAEKINAGLELVRDLTAVED